MGEQSYPLLINMRSAALSTTFIVASTGLSTLYTPDDPQAMEALWEGYKADFQRSYAAQEETARFNIFVENLKIIDVRNQKETGSATFGINQFADLSADEFEGYYLTAHPPAARGGEVRQAVDRYNGTESLVDWTGIYTTPVKDQGYCGSCWAFSATEQVESDAMRQLGSSYTLSVNQMLQCTIGGYVPCQGGWTEAGYEYVRREGGLEQEEDYPYEDVHMSDCKAEARKEVVGVRQYTTIIGEENMAAYVKTTGPLSVCLSATGWEFYTGGIMESCPNYVNHCVQAVGVDDSTVGGYWKVRNSYGPHWGEGGYIRLAYGQNTCFITRDPTYVDTFLVD